MAGNKLNLNLVARAFDSRLSQEAFVVLILLAITAVCFNVIKAQQLKRSVPKNPDVSVSGEAQPEIYRMNQPGKPNSAEASFKKILRVGFGILWVLDGLLQMQSSMPIELPNSVIAPSVSGSPEWVKEIVRYALEAWQRHPITYATGVAWIQLGIGLFVLIAPSGFMLRMAGTASALWAILVWVFGESLGGIFAPRPSWLFGTPGAALIYFFAGVFLALPDGYLGIGRRKRRVAGSVGLYFLAMLILQIWPGNGYWISSAGSHKRGPLANDVARMSQMSQPEWLKRTLLSFASFVNHESLLTNLLISLALGLTAFAFFLPYKRLRLYVLIGQSALAVFVWVFFQDLGFIGGVGTDTNSMLPTLIIVYAAHTLDYGNLISFDKSELSAKVNRLRAAVKTGKRKSVLPTGMLGSAAIPGTAVDIFASGPEGNGVTDTAKENSGRVPKTGPVAVRKAFNPRNIWRRTAEKPLGTVMRLLMSFEAVAVIGMGALPAAIDTGNQSVSPLVAEAYVGVPYVSNGHADNFTLTDQNGRSISLDNYRHKKIVFLVFLDPVCTSACPLIAQEIKKTDILLGKKSRFVEFVAVDANPLYYSTSYLNAFDRAEKLNTLVNWQYLTGGKKALNNVWNNYGISVSYAVAGAMVVHSEVAYLIDQNDRIKEILNDSPVYGNNTVKGSFVSMFYDAISKYLPKKSN